MQLRGWDVEVCDPVSPASIHNGSCYIDTAAGVAPPAACLPAPTAMKPTRAGPPSRPPQRKQQTFNLEEALILDQPGEDAAPVYVPAFLARKLRPHQRQGVQFLYNVWPTFLLAVHLFIRQDNRCMPWSWGYSIYRNNP